MSRSSRRAALALLVVVVASVGGAGPASAHAVLLSSNPPDGAQLDAAPSVVVLEFSERVSAGLGAVRVFDAGGARVDQGSSIVEGHTISAPLQPDLGDGAYIVSWRAVSADSHPIHGALTFTVGDGPAADDATIAGLVGGGADGAFELAGHAGRALAYGGSLLAAGLAAFLVLAHDGGEEAGPLRRRLRLAAAVGAFGVVVAIPVRAALATGLGLGAITEPGVLGQVLADGIGVSTAATLLGVAVVAYDGGRRGAVSLAGGAVAVGAFAFAGHTVTANPVWLAISGDLAHSVAGAVWLGGLAGLVAVLRTRRGERSAEAAPVVAQFSGIAAIALLVVAVAGTALAWEEVRAVRALTGTSYGQLLLAKVAVVAVVAALGGWNRYRLVPSLDKAPKAAAARLRRTVRIEAALLLSTVALTAVLVNVTPARAAAGIGTIFSTTVELGDGSVNLVVDPNQAGFNSVHLYLFDETGRTYSPEEGLTLDLSLPAAAIGPLDREPFVAGPGHWQLDSADLSIPGTWTIEIHARISRFDEASATVEVNVNP